MDQALDQVRIVVRKPPRLPRPLSVYPLQRVGLVVIEMFSDKLGSLYRIFPVFTGTCGRRRLKYRGKSRKRSNCQPVPTGYNLVVEVRPRPLLVAVFEELFAPRLDDGEYLIVVDAVCLAELLDGSDDREYILVDKLVVCVILRVDVSVAVYVPVS